MHLLWGSAACIFRESLFGFQRNSKGACVNADFSLEKLRIIVGGFGGRSVL